MTHRASLLALALLLVSSLPADAQTSADPVDALVTAYHDTGRFVGTVLVADGGEVVYEAGLGEANRSWDIPHTPATRFRIASLTKQFTAALVLQLVEAGAMDLDAPITRYLPDYPAEQGRVTIHQLLSQTSGIPEHLGLPDFDTFKRSPVEPDAFPDLFSALPLVFEPGTAYQYSNSNYVLLGVLIEAVTGQPFAEALRERLLDPLGLADTGYDDGATVLDRMATGYRRGASGVSHAEYVDPSVPYAAGMMYSTTSDLFAWTQALHGGEVFERAETLERMTTPVLDNYAYGLGVMTLPVGDGGVRAVGHSGGIFGFSTFLLHVPEDGRTVVVLANLETPTQPLALDLMRALYGEAVDMPSRPLRDLLAEVIEAEGIDAAITRYREIRAADDGTVDLGENELNALGYAYLGRGEVEAAIRLFQLNVEMFPESWNPYDSLGEAFAVAGDRAQAVANYERALALNPGAMSARDALTRLGAEVAAETVAVPAEVLAGYVGVYQLQPGLTVTITLVDGALVAQPTGRSPVDLVPLSETRFDAPRVGAQVTFAPGDDGRAASMTLHGGGGPDMVGARVE